MTVSPTASGAEVRQPCGKLLAALRRNNLRPPSQLKALQPPRQLRCGRRRSSCPRHFKPTEVQQPGTVIALCVPLADGRAWGIDGLGV